MHRVELWVPGKRLWLTALYICLIKAGCTTPMGVLAEENPEETISWGRVGRGWGPWGSSGSYMYAASVGPVQLDIWQWTGNTMKQRCSDRSKEHILSIAISSHDTWIADVLDPKDGQSYFFVGEMRSSGTADGRLVPSDRWVQPHELYIKLGRGSRDGKYVAAWCQPESTSEVPQQKEDQLNFPVRFGFVLPQEKRLELVAGASISLPSSMIHETVPSDNGAYIALGGWNNGVGMIDVTKKKVSWLASWQYKPVVAKLRPPGDLPWKAVPFEEDDTLDLVFTPDSKLIYSGGRTGCVFGMNVETGQIVSEWWATPSGKMESGYHVTTISVSPDGKYVAAGTSPAGHVYLFSTKDGQRRALNHGGSTILMTSFSPDSKRLATYAAGEIKTWKIH